MAGHSTRVAATLIAIVAAVGCGKKGPPLAPFVRVPASVADVAVQRIGSEVFVSFAVPSANVDGQQPADIGSLEVYAVTATAPPATDEDRKLATLIATLPVRPIAPVLPPAVEGVPLPPLPQLPGIDRGAPAVTRETLTADKLLPVTFPPREGAVVTVEPADVEPVAGPLVAPASAQLPRRYYFVVAISPRGRKAPPSNPVPVPLDPASSAPGAPKVTYTESEMTVQWTPSPDARSAAFLEPPVVKVPVAVPGSVSPANITPAAPVLAPLPAKSLGFQSEATTYHLYEVLSTSAGEDPFAIALPVALTPQPVTVTEQAIKGVTFGAERCFVARPVERAGETVVIGPASPKTCVTPVDTFPPAAPKVLQAIASEGVINLIWEANTESDLAGYLVLRGEAPGDTLRAITSEPVQNPAYRDTSVRPGVRYVYVVVAVDRATPQNVSAQSNRYEETARQ